MSFRILKSVLSAMLGVQRSKDAEEDFTQGNPWIYLCVGVACLVVFVVTLVIVVRIVLSP